MTLDKTNVLVVYFVVFYKGKAIFGLLLFSYISGKDMGYLSNF